MSCMLRVNLQPHKPLSLLFSFDLAGNVYYSLGGAPTPPTPATSSPSSSPTDSPSQQCQGIVDIAVGNPDFSTLVAALTAADLVDALSGDGPLTVFGTHRCT